MSQFQKIEKSFKDGLHSVGRHASSCALAWVLIVFIALFASGFSKVQVVIVKFPILRAVNSFTPQKTTLPKEVSWFPFIRQLSNPHFLGGGGTLGRGMLTSHNLLSLLPETFILATVFLPHDFFVKISVQLQHRSWWHVLHLHPISPRGGGLGILEVRMWSSWFLQTNQI